MNITHIAKSCRGLPRLALAGAVALSMGCDTDALVEVEDPSALRPEEVFSPAAVPSLVAGAYRQFQGGYSGLGLDDAFIAGSAAISDETYWGDTFTTRFAADSRNLQPVLLGNISDAPFNRLMQARFNARRAFATLEEFADDASLVDSADVYRARLRTIEGYAFVTLSEGWCGAVPFSRFPETGSIDPARIEYGESLTTRQMNDTAVVRFNESLGYNTADTLAMVGKGRALLNSGLFAQAATAVAGMRTDYVFHFQHSVNLASENNPAASLQQNGRYGVSNLEGAQTAAGAALRPDLNTHPPTAASAEGLPFRALRDPRVSWQARPDNSGRCFSSAIFCWWNMNYFGLEADIPLASGVEARLIEAEAALQAAQPSVMMTKLNELRAAVATLLPRLYPNQRQAFLGPAGVPALDPLTDPGIGLLTPAEQFEARRALLFRERALWLYHTGHRQGDLRRLVRNYGFTTSQVFPSGPYFRSTAPYGADVAFPVPFNEQNNPNYDPTECVNTQA
jgi:hypothetical protein